MVGYEHVITVHAHGSLSLLTGDGDTAMYVCAFYGWLDLMRYLVETRGCDPKGK